MSYKIKLLQEAFLDIKEIVKWYNEEQPGLGKRFYGSLKLRLSYIKKYPLHFHVNYRDVRDVLVENFPYQVHYRVEEPDKLIIVLAITHTSRDPSVWKTKR